MWQTNKFWNFKNLTEISPACRVEMSYIIDR